MLQNALTASGNSRVCQDESSSPVQYIELVFFRCGRRNIPEAKHLTRRFDLALIGSRDMERELAERFVPQSSNMLFIELLDQLSESKRNASTIENLANSILRPIKDRLSRHAAPKFSALIAASYGELPELAALLLGLRAPWYHYRECAGFPLRPHEALFMSGDSIYGLTHIVRISPWNGESPKSGYRPVRTDDKQDDPVLEDATAV